MDVKRGSESWTFLCRNLFDVSDFIWLTMLGKLSPENCSGSSLGNPLLSFPASFCCTCLPRHVRGMPSTCQQVMTLCLSAWMQLSPSCEHCSRSFTCDVNRKRNSMKLGRTHTNSIDIQSHFQIHLFTAFSWLKQMAHTCNCNQQYRQVCLLISHRCFLP